MDLVLGPEIDAHGPAGQQRPGSGEMNATPRRLRLLEGAPESVRQRSPVVQATAAASGNKLVAVMPGSVLSSLTRRRPPGTSAL